MRDEPGMLALPEGDLSVLFGSKPTDMEFELGDGGELREVSPEDDLMPSRPEPKFASNLADDIDAIDPTFLPSLAADLIELIDADIETRAPWVARYMQGMQMMGLIDSEIDDGPFPGASTATMPVIAEAVVQFWARAMGEQVPADGPAKAAVLGKANKKLVDRARRVSDFMNYDIMFQDRAWYNNHSRMLFALPTAGSCFKKVYRDLELGRNVSAYIPAEDFIVNCHYTELEDCPRFTHRVWRSPAEILRLQHAGLYRKIDLGQPDTPMIDEQLEIKLESVDTDASAADERDDQHELYEVYVDTDLPGKLADLDAAGIETKVPRPYVITIDKASSKILSVYRDWKEQDPLKRRRTIVHSYFFLPGPGIYGYGLWHIIGGLQQAATGLLRAIVDGSATASLQGGFLSKDGGLKDQSLIIEPGVWKQLDASYEDLSKSFYTPPFKEPSAILFQILGLVVARAEKFAATTEMMTGDTNAKNAPVGSTLALIEQGGKVFSAIHKGLFRSLAGELRSRYELIQEYMPTEGYPYDVDGAHEGLFAEDFQPGVQVLPVSDPNIFTDAQRIAQNQAVYDLSVQNPDIVRRQVAVRRTLEGLRVPDIEELLITNNPPPPMDPVSQVAALLRGEPVQAYPDQHHMAHLQHLTAFVSNPQFGGNPQVQAQIGPAVLALIGQHAAYAWVMHARAQGVPVEPPPPVIEGDEGPGQGQQQMLMGAGMGQGMGPGAPPVPPEMVAEIAAQIAPSMAQAPGIPVPPDPKAEAEAQKMQADVQAKMADGERKLVESQQKLALDAQAQQQKIAADAANAELKLLLEQAKAEQKLAIETMKAEAQAQAAQMKAISEAASERLKLEHDFKINVIRQEAEADKAAKESQQRTVETNNAAKQGETTHKLIAGFSDVLSNMSTAMSAPKRVIRDPNTDRVIGLAPDATLEAPKPKSGKGKRDKLS